MKQTPSTFSWVRIQKMYMNTSLSTTNWFRIDVFRINFYSNTFWLQENTPRSPNDIIHFLHLSTRSGLRFVTHGQNLEKKNSLCSLGNIYQQVLAYLYWRPTENLIVIPQTYWGIWGNWLSWSAVGTPEGGCTLCEGEGMWRQGNIYYRGEIGAGGTDEWRRRSWEYGR